MSNLKDFVSARFDEDEAAIKNRDLQLPIHFVGCYYYEYTLDANLHCDCDEDGEASKKVLAEIHAKRQLVAAFTGHDQALIVALLAVPYSQHPDFPNPLA